MTCDFLLLFRVSFKLLSVKQIILEANGDRVEDLRRKLEMETMPTINNK